MLILVIELKRQLDHLGTRLDTSSLDEIAFELSKDQPK